MDKTPILISTVEFIIHYAKIEVIILREVYDGGEK